MLKTTTIIETRYPECDMMGIVHHSVYAVWYEAARMDFFQAMGFSFSDMNALGVNPAMVDLHLQFKAPAAYPQTLRIETRIGQFAPRKLQLLYEIKNAADEVVNAAETFHVWTGPDNRAYNVEENLPEVYARIRSASGQE